MARSLARGDWPRGRLSLGFDGFGNARVLGHMRLLILIGFSSLAIGGCASGVRFHVIGSSNGVFGVAKAMP
jgi:hypothetical protein